MVLSEVRQIPGHHALKLGWGVCGKKYAAELEVEDLVQFSKEPIHPLLIFHLLYVVIMYGVNCGLDDCPGVLGEEEVL